MNYMRLGGVLMTILFLTACVTINIYFPAAQAEQAAERIVEDILGDQPNAPQMKKDKQDGASLEQPLFKRVAGGVLNLLIPAAHAAQPDFNASSPEVRKLQAGMKQRNGALVAHYQSGAVGFTRDGLITIRNKSAVPLKERKRVQGLVQAENKDRNALYKAIAAANGHPEWEPEIRSTFARTWVNKASSGWWYQNAAGKWVQK